MAVEYREDGTISLKSRLCYFRNGRPTNPEQWEFFERVPEMVKGRPCTVSRDLINETWNPIIDASGMVLCTSFDCFKDWCCANKIQMIDDPSSLFIKMKYKDYIVTDDGKEYLGYYEYMASLEGMPLDEWLEENE